MFYIEKKRCPFHGNNVAARFGENFWRQKRRVKKK